MTGALDLLLKNRHYIPQRDRNVTWVGVNSTPLRRFMFCNISPIFNLSPLTSIHSWIFEKTSYIMHFSLTISTCSKKILLIIPFIKNNVGVKLLTNISSIFHFCHLYRSILCGFYFYIYFKSSLWDPV
jgi:hypothetical protein